MKSIRSLFFFLGMLFAGSVYAQDVESMAVSCDGCHGKKGVSQWTDMPTIAGIDAFTHSNALFAYQDEARPCEESEFRCGDTTREPTTMCAAVAGFGDEQIEAIAAHYAALPFVAAEQEFDSALAATGKAIHEEKCARCHSDGGGNPEDEASILAGQQMGYLQRTFEEYASGAREQPKPMKDKMDTLSGDDAKALVNFYASQQ